MGEPAYPSKAQVAQLEDASALVWGPLPAGSVTNAEPNESGSGGASFTLTIPANGLAVVDMLLKD